MSPGLLLSLCLSVLADDEMSLEVRVLATIPKDLSATWPQAKPVNGQHWPSAYTMVFRPDGGQVAYVGHKGEQAHVVVGNDVHDRYDFLSRPVFQGEKALFRAGNRISKSKEKWWVVADGKKQKAHDWMGEIAVGPNGDLAYWTQPGATVDATGMYSRGDHVLVYGKKKSKKWNGAATMYAPLFSEDGKRIAAASEKGGTWFGVVFHSRGEERLTKGHSMIDSMTLRHDGREVACSIWAGPSPSGVPGAMKMAILVGKETHGEDYESAGCPVYSPDGRKVAFKFQREGRMGVTVTGDEDAKAPYDFVHIPVFSPDGKSLAYVANVGADVRPEFALTRMNESMLVPKGKYFLVQQDAKPRAKPKIVREAEGILHVTYAPDGRVACVAKDAKGWRMFVGNLASDAFEFVGPPHFSGDGKAVGFGALKGKELWWQVMEI